MQQMGWSGAGAAVGWHSGRVIFKRRDRHGGQIGTGRRGMSDDTQAKFEGID